MQLRGIHCWLLTPLTAAPAQAPPTFSPPTLLTAAFLVSADVAARDLNGDGVPDLVQANPGPAIGFNTVGFRAKLLEDTGAEIGNAAGAAPAGTLTLNAATRVAVGDFDEDGLADLVSLTYGLCINYARNQGQSQAIGGFATTALVDDLSRIFTCVWPATLHAPVFEVEDFDRDGHLDLLLAPAIVDYWNQNMSPPGLFLYRGQGDGTFAPVASAPLASTPIDADWVDWDGDAVPETIVLLGQQVPNALQTLTDVTRFRIAAGAPQPIGASQPLPSVAFATSLVHIARQPGMGDHSAYFVTGHSMPLRWIMQPELWVIDVDAQGVVGTGNRIALPAAFASGPLGELQAGAAADFDGDGMLDLAAIYAAGLVAAGEVLCLMGPLDSFGGHNGIAMVGLGALAETRNGPPSSTPTTPPVWMPNLVNPRALAVTDLDLDQRPDLLVGGLLQVNSQGNRETLSAVLTNRTTVATQHGSAQRVGPGRPWASGNTARCGTAGGLPVLGNTGFAVTLGNAPRDALIGLLGGTVPATFQWQGLQMTFAPDAFSQLQWIHFARDGAGRAAMPLPIPNWPGLLGTQCFCQWMLFVPTAADPFPIYSSDALRIEVGRLQP